MYLIDPPYEPRKPAEALSGVDENERKQEKNEVAPVDTSEIMATKLQNMPIYSLGGVRIGTLSVNATETEGFRNFKIEKESLDEKTEASPVGPRKRITAYSENIGDLAAKRGLSVQEYLNMIFDGPPRDRNDTQPETGENESIEEVPDTPDLEV